MDHEKSDVIYQYKTLNTQWVKHQLISFRSSKTLVQAILFTSLLTVSHVNFHSYSPSFTFLLQLLYFSSWFSSWFSSSSLLFWMLRGVSPSIAEDKLIYVTVYGARVDVLSVLPGSEVSTLQFIVCQSLSCFVKLEMSSRFLQISDGILIILLPSSSLLGIVGKSSLVRSLVLVCYISSKLKIVKSIGLYGSRDGLMYQQHQVRQRQHLSQRILNLLRFLLLFNLRLRFPPRLLLPRTILLSGQVVLSQPSYLQQGTIVLVAKQQTIQNLHQ